MEAEQGVGGGAGTSALGITSHSHFENDHDFSTLEVAASNVDIRIGDPDYCVGARLDAKRR